MQILERIISIIAPHECLGCGVEGSLICEGCMSAGFPGLPSRCFMCLALTKDARVCSKCRHKSALTHVWIRTDYSGIAKRLISALKFERSSAAAQPIALLMREVLPYTTRDVMVVPVPTASSRVRQRGYDQAWLIARQLAVSGRLRPVRALVRFGQSRQVGATRAVRQRQMTDAFRCSLAVPVDDMHIILVDDVLTTGSSLEAAARVLKQAGAKQVDAIVFAQKQE